MSNGYPNSHGFSLIEYQNDNWRAEALCAGQPQEMFFPEDKKDVSKEARQMCAECPVKEECLAFAIRTGEKHGLWGGLSPKKRRPLRKAYLLSIGETETSNELCSD